MNGLLGLAADFVERVGNPTYGREVNELYRARLEWLLAEDEHLDRSLGRLELGRDDVPALSVDAWLWYMRWRCLRHPLPRDDFLDALFEATDEPAVHIRILELVVRHPGAAEKLGAATGDRPPPLEELPIPWLARRLLYSLDHGRDDSGHAVEASAIAIYLVQLGDPASIAVLRGLLSDPRAPEAGLDPFELLQGVLDEEALLRLLRELGLER